MYVFEIRFHNEVLNNNMKYLKSSMPNFIRFQGNIKVVYCGHTYCVKCTREYDGYSICEQNPPQCKGNPPKTNFLHMQQSLAANEVCNFETSS